MKPVTQTITGPTGNCMGACLASILEVPIEAVPNFFDAGSDDSDWWNALRAWLRKFGLGIITLTFENAAQWRNLRLSGYHIVSGPSPRLEGMHHATVWHDGAMVHDPHPDGTGIVRPETLDMLYLIEPASLHMPASILAALTDEQVKTSAEGWPPQAMKDRLNAARERAAADYHEGRERLANAPLTGEDDAPPAA